MNEAESRTYVIARKKNDTTRARTLLTGCRLTTIQAANRIATTAAASKTSRAIGLSRPQDLDAGRPEQIDEGQREEDLPAETHELVVTESRQRPAHPDEHRHEERGLRREDEERENGSDDPMRVEPGQRPAAEVEGGRQRARDDDVDVLGEEEGAEVHRRVLGVIPGHELRFRLRQVERQPVRLREGRDEEDEEAERLEHDPPAGQDPEDR